MDLEKLISEVSAISKRYELINQKTGGYFNIFEIANISTDEVKICRVIYELINPKGSHYQKSTYLKLFVKYVLGVEKEITDDEYKGIRVHREYIIENGRRIDLVIESKNKFIPIEVKLNAEDQPKQCYDYFQKAKNSKIYYLTLDGRSPSPESAAGLAPIKNKDEDIEGWKEVEQISFANHILVWLEKCIEDQETIRIAPIREVLLQLIMIIRKLTNQIGEGEEMDIVDVISSSSENFKSAENIANSLNQTKTKMLKKVLVELEKKVEVIAKEKGFKKENKYLFYAEEGRADNYYNHQYTTYPGINYYCNKITDDIDLWFRIEIDNRIFAGLYAFNNKKNESVEIDNSLENEIKKHIQQEEIKIENCWANFEYVPNENSCPNFKNFNEAYYNLYNSVKFETFINDSEKSIKEMIENMFG